MKIALLGDALIKQNAGVYYYTFDFYKRLIANYPNHKYYLIVPQSFGKLDTEEIIVPIKNLPLHQRLRQFTDIPKAVKKIKADLVIEPAHFGPFNIPKSIKRVTIIHDLTPIKFPQFHKRLDTSVHRLMLDRIMSKANHIIVNSNTTKTDVEKTYRQSVGKINIIYPTVKRQLLNHRIGLDQLGVNKRYILSVGTVEPRKNHIGLIKAFEKLCEKTKKFDLVITGKKGWKNQALFAALENSPVKEKIIFPGYVSRTQLWQLYENADLFVYPSFYEGFGMPVMEAMAANTMLLLSDAPSLMEVAGDAAFYFDVNDQKAFNQKLLSLMGDDAKLLNNSKILDQRVKELSNIASQQMTTLGKHLGL